MTLLATLFVLAPLGSQPVVAVPRQPAAPAREELSIRWRNKSYALAALPAELGPGPAAAALAWKPFVVERDYQLHLDVDGRVLLISSKRNGKVKRQLKLIADTSKLFDQLLPAPPRVTKAHEVQPPAEEESVGARTRRQDDEIPEDPGGPPGGWLGRTPATQTEPYTFEWGSGTWPVDTETCVMFVVRDEADYAAVLERLGELQEYLRPWLATAERYTGFVLEKPLVGAYIEHAAGMEEWEPDNEVVNRVAQMLFVRRFSQQPYWLVQGVAWHIELKLRKGIYCYPYRDEFIWATEHTGWHSVLRNRFKDRARDPLRLEEFTHWTRGGYDDELAKLSFGMAEFLTRYHAEDLSAFAEELRLFRDQHNRIDLGNGNWERKVDYQVPDEELARIMAAHFGARVLEDASGYFRKGKSFRLPRKR